NDLGGIDNQGIPGTTLRMQGDEAPDSRFIVVYLAGEPSVGTFPIQGSQGGVIVTLGDRQGHTSAGSYRYWDATAGAVRITAISADKKWVDFTLDNVAMSADPLTSPHTGAAGSFVLAAQGRCYLPN